MHSSGVFCACLLSMMGGRRRGRRRMGWGAAVVGGVWDGHKECIEGVLDG